MKSRLYSADGLIHGERPRGKTEEPEKKDWISAMSKKKLVREGLCRGKISPCTMTGECEVLDACRYGQRYLELSSRAAASGGKKDGK